MGGGIVKIKILKEFWQKTLADKKMHKTRAGICMQNLKIIFILFHIYKAVLSRACVVWSDFC